MLYPFSPLVHHIREPSHLRNSFQACIPTLAVFRTLVWNYGQADHHSGSCLKHVIASSKPQCVRSLKESRLTYKMNLKSNRRQLRGTVGACPVIFAVKSQVHLEHPSIRLGLLANSAALLKHLWLLDSDQFFTSFCVESWGRSVR